MAYQEALGVGHLKALSSLSPILPREPTVVLSRYRKPYGCLDFVGASIRPDEEPATLPGEFALDHTGGGETKAGGVPKLLINIPAKKSTVQFSAFYFHVNIGRSVFNLRIINFILDPINTSRFIKFSHLYGLF